MKPWVLAGSALHPGMVKEAVPDRSLMVKYLEYGMRAMSRKCVASRSHQNYANDWYSGGCQPRAGGASRFACWLFASGRANAVAFSDTDGANRFRVPASAVDGESQTDRQHQCHGGHGRCGGSARGDS